MAEVCSSCKAPIKWAITSGGHPMPLDVEPVGDGNLRLYSRGEDVMPRVVVVPPSSRVDGQLLFVAHFRTCPYADQHRRRR